MENLMNQIRLIFTGAEESGADLSGIRDQKIPSQKEEAQNWFPRQFLRKMSNDYDSLEIERATAIAAAAFAVTSQYFSEQKTSEGPENLLTKTKSKISGLSRKLSGSFKSSDGLFNKVPIFPVTDEKKPEKILTPVSSTKKTSTSSDHLNRDDTKPEVPPPRKTLSFGDTNLKKTEEMKPAIPEPKLAPPIKSEYSSLMLLPPPPPPPQPQKVRNDAIKPGPPKPPTPPTRVNTNEKKAAAWEREQLETIKERYDKLKLTINSWENKKKAKARRKLEKKEMSSSEKERRKAYAKFNSNIEYINGIVRSASAEAEERRRNEEHKIREKAKVIRTTGKLPGTCPCF
ncbi:remorin 1.4-like isoform X1 [Prosopis cineraria]|uniref:remorin 1.4-like isoform X1 n=2 Tax=Prosopis cineraria TaxID=364024 RepID=UPI00241034A9|nr:remorin 1.4-like isoform X1 [Prosopis cineraria]